MAAPQPASLLEGRRAREAGVLPMASWHICGSLDVAEHEEKCLGRLVAALRREGMAVTARTGDRVLFRAEESGGALRGVAEGEIVLFGPETAQGITAPHRIIYRLSLDRLVAALYLTMTALLGACLVAGSVMKGGLHVEGAFWATPASIPLYVMYRTRRFRIRRSLRQLLREVVGNLAPK